MNTFQTILTAVFGIFIILGVVLFATFKGGGSEVKLSPVTLWGTIDSGLVDELVGKVNLGREDQVDITYVEKRAADFDQDFIEALARGEGPDAIILSQDKIVRHADKLTLIPYDVFTERAFKDTYVEGTELFLAPAGILAFPLAVDPFVMYWNRDIFTDAGIPTYPKLWSEVVSLVPSLVKKDNAGNIRQSAVAMGEFRNVVHAKEILAALIMQAGNPIVSRTQTGFEAVINDSLGGTTVPSHEALAFYTSFANPARPAYSWNRSLQSSKNAFLAGDLAAYFGFASEVAELREKNPNLNFDVAPLPQLPSGKRLTFGNMYGLALVKAGPNPSNAYVVLSSLLTTEAATQWSALAKLPPVRRDLLSVRPADPYMSSFYDAALIARAWYDPDAGKTAAILETATEAVTSGRQRIPDAMSEAEENIGTLIQN